MDKKFIIENNLLNLSIKEILDKRLLSKNYKNIIDNSDYLWEKLIEREYDIKFKSKKELFIQIRELHKFVEDKVINHIYKYRINGYRISTNPTFKNYNNTMIKIFINYFQDNKYINKYHISL